MNATIRSPMTPTPLSETQALVLAAACQREGGLVLPLPAHIKGGAAHKVIASLLAKGLIREAPARRGQPVWRTHEHGPKVTLVVTRAAFAALGIAEPTVTAKPRRSRQNSKQALLIEMLKRPEGASLDEIATTLDWRRHSVRGAIAGALKKKLGLTVVSETVGGVRTYRIEG